jgi:hypothetical protein
MKIIIAGSRTITDKDKVYSIITAGLNSLSTLERVEIVSGGARGVDKLGELYAVESSRCTNRYVDLKVFSADWNKYGKRAGYLRNKQMAEYADALILIWDGKSRGSQMMLELAKQYKLKIYEQVI